MPQPYPLSSTQSWEEARPRRLIAGFLLSAVLWGMGLLIFMRTPFSSPISVTWAGVMVVIALFCAGLTYWAALRNKQRFIDKIASTGGLLLALGILRRIGFLTLGSYGHDLNNVLFMPIFAYMPVIYVWMHTFVRGRAPSIVSWAFLLSTITITFGGVGGRLLADLGRPDHLNLVIWLLLCNPLFLLALAAVPALQHLMQETDQENQALAQVNDSEYRFNLVVETLQVGVWDYRLKPQPQLWWSPRIYELLGRSPDLLPATPDNAKGLFHPSDVQQGFTQALKKIRTGGSIEINARLLTDRGYRWFNLIGRAHSENGSPVRWVGAIADIHDSVEAKEQLIAAERELRVLAYRDGLTGLHNRRAFDEAILDEWARFRRNQQSFSLLLIDIDNFKYFNDQYGHSVGDDLIKLLGKTIAGQLKRTLDLACRVGGEEFAVLLPCTGRAGALRVAETLRASAAILLLPQAEGPPLHCTISIGVACAYPDDAATDPSELYQRADQALYQSKRSGRNKVSVYG